MNDEDHCSDDWHSAVADDADAEHCSADCHNIPRRPWCVR